MSKDAAAGRARSSDRPACGIFVMRILLPLVAACVPLYAAADWSADAGAAAGWESDAGDDLEHRGSAAAAGSAWAFAGRSLPVSDAARLHLGAGWAGRLVFGHEDLSHHALVGEAAVVWTTEAGGLLRLAPWAAGRLYGDPARSGWITGLSGVVRHPLRPGFALRGTGRASLRRAADPAFDALAFGVGAGLEIDVTQAVWVRAAYGFEGIRWPGAGGTVFGPVSPPIGGRPGPGATGTGGSALVAHVLSATLNLEGPAGLYGFGEYAFTWLSGAGGGWPIHAVLAGGGVRR